LNSGETATRALGIGCEIEKVTDVDAIVDAGVLRTPALGLHGEILVEGKVASAEELEALLKG
jgi:hypothetical protein